jgi:hypothetical protein
MDLISQIKILENNVNSLESNIIEDMKRKLKLKEENKSDYYMDSMLKGHGEDLKKYQLKLKLLIKDIPQNEDNLIYLKAHNDLQVKIESLLSCIKKNKIPNKGTYLITDDSESKNTNMTLENKEVSDEFSNVIKKIKQISQEIDTNIAKEQVLIDHQYNTMNEIQEEVSETKIKLNQFMEKSSNTCLIVTVVIEICILVFIFITI